MRSLIFAVMLFPAVAVAQPPGLSVDVGPNGKSVVSINGHPLPGSTFATTPAPTPGMARYAIVSAANALEAIGQYKCPGTGPGQQPVVDCYLKVSIATRSALAHDLAVLIPIAREPAPPQSAAEEAVCLQTSDYQRLRCNQMMAADAYAWSQTRVPVEGLIKLSEEDLDLASNPQITPADEAALAPLMKK